MTTHTALQPHMLTHSVDSGVCVNKDLSFDVSLQSTDCGATSDHRENNQVDGPETNSQPEAQNSNEEPAERNSEDRDMNYAAISDPGLVTGTAGGLKGSTSAVTPEMDNTKALSMLALPPPLPPKRRQRSPTFEKTSSPGQEFKAFNTEDKTLKSLACQMSPVLGGVTDNTRCSDLISGKVPNTHNNYTFGTLPKLQPQCVPQPPQRPPPKPVKSSQVVNSKWRKHNKKTRDTMNMQKRDLTETNEMMGENEEKSEMEYHLNVSKPVREILVLFTDIEKDGEKMKEDEYLSDTELTPTMTENPSLPPSGEKPDSAATSCNSTVSPKPGPMIPALPPPKSYQKCPPKPPIKPPHLLSTMRAGIEEEKERRNQEEKQWREKDLLDEERDENGGERKDRGEVNGEPRDTELTSPTVTEISSQLGEMVKKSTSNTSGSQEVESPRGGTLDGQSQHQWKQHQSEANRQVKSGPLPQEVPAQINPIGPDSNMEMIKWTEKSKGIQMSGQGGQVISDLPPGFSEGTEVVGTQFSPCQPGLKRLEDVLEIVETPPDGKAKQTNQKPGAKGKVRQLAKKVMCRLKEGREEKRRTKVGEIEIEGITEDETEVAQDDRRHGGEEGMKAKEEEVMNEDAAVTKIASHVDLIEKSIKRRNATSESPFSSFKVCSPVKLVEELLAGDEWSQFVYQSSTAELTSQQTEDTAQFNSDLEPSVDVFEGNPPVPEEEPIYEDVNLLSVITEEQQERNTAPVTALPQVLLESDTHLMSPRTKDIYETVKFIEPVQPANTYNEFTFVKSQVVLDSSVQKYLIKLNKKRKHRTVWKRRRDRNHETHSQSPLSTSPQQVFPTSVFYNVLAVGGEEEQQLSAIKSGGSSPRSLAKIKKTALKDKTILRPAQPKEGRGK
ncbi:uncharacterized protein LOC108872805 isoform X2 [Lates calcarifer]|uniref:Uncharacterized protein LOC108872805 isoform X2 n=1 Tax=Lates calcarifer TaxID=8187 RepID=A0AAJ7L8X9_LATCA|nr:uncharacterized protein LOC108872805 isoform X2 [Lates calcarifer]